MKMDDTIDLVRTLCPVKLEKNELEELHAAFSAVVPDREEYVEIIKLIEDNLKDVDQPLLVNLFQIRNMVHFGEVIRFAEESGLVPMSAPVQFHQAMVKVIKAGIEKAQSDNCVVVVDGKSQFN